MARLLICLVLAIYSATICHGADLYVSHSPSGLKFDEAGSLRMSAVDDMLAAAMGYSHESSPWAGLEVLSPFSSPAAAIVIAVEGSGASVPLTGHHYSVQEDLSLLKVFDSLNSTVSATSQRPTHLQYLEVADGISPDFVSLPASSSLNPDKERDSSFLFEAGALPHMVDRLKGESSVSHGGQDFIFYKISSFSLLVKTYGDGSPQVNEAKNLLSEAIQMFTSKASHLYKEKVLVMSLVFDKSPQTLVRKTRQARAGSGDLNLANEYSTDYPAVFNIILFLSIVMAVAVLASAMATAYMDPGRDSIIYRMTNPKMKKDQ